MRKLKSKGLRCESREEWLSALAYKGIGIKKGHFPDNSGGLTNYTSFHVSTAKALVVFAHGTGNDHIFTMQSLFERLLDEGYAIFSFDLPGHGEESSTLLSRESFWSASHSLSESIKRENQKNLPLIALAYSLGGLFLLNVAHQASLNFQQIILLSVPIRVKISPSFLCQEALSFFSKAFYRQWQNYSWQEALPAFGPFRREDFPIRLDPSIKEDYPQFVGKLFEERPPHKLLASLTCPSLLVLGQRDKLAPPSDSVHWRSLSPKLKLVVVDRANHFLLPFLKPTQDAIIREMLL